MCMSGAGTTTRSLLDLDRPFVGSDSAGSSWRHPIATRALVSYAPAGGYWRIQHCHQKRGQGRASLENFALYFYFSDELDVAPDDGVTPRAGSAPRFHAPLPPRSPDPTAYGSAHAPSAPRS